MACACKKVERINRFAGKRYGKQMDDGIYYSQKLLKALWLLVVKIFVCLCIVVATLPIMLLIIISYLFKDTITFKLPNKVVKIIDKADE